MAFVAIFGPFFVQNLLDYINNRYLCGVITNKLWQTN